VRWAWSPLDGPGAVLLAVGTPSAVATVLDAVTDRCAEPLVGGGHTPDPTGSAALVGA
jgi:hypothetical protein